MRPDSPNEGPQREAFVDELKTAVDAQRERPQQQTQAPRVPLQPSPSPDAAPRQDDMVNNASSEKSLTRLQFIRIIQSEAEHARPIRLAGPFGNLKTVQQAEEALTPKRRRRGMNLRRVAKHAIA